MKSQYDLIVAGIGAMGSAALYQAAKRGLSVLGIDRFEPPHTFGSSHGETRVTRLSIGEGEAYIPLVNRSNEIWRELEAISGEQLYSVCGGYIIYPKGKGDGYHGNADFGSETAVLAQKHHIEHEIREASQVRHHLPQLLMQPDENAYWEPGAGALHVENCIKVQIEAAARLGATTLFNTPLSTFQSDNQKVTVSTTAGRFTADNLILTTGAWLPQMLPKLTSEKLTVTRQIMYWFEAENLDWWKIDRFPVLLWQGKTLPQFFGVFPTLHNGFPGVKVLTEQFEETTTPNLVSREVQPYEVEHFYDTLLKKKLAGVKRNCLKTAVCLYTNTSNGHFLIDHHPESDRILFASPCSGHGFKHSAAIGEALVETAVYGQSKIDISSFKLRN